MNPRSFYVRKFSRNFKPTQYGVTMMELIVVVAIVAILAALALPNFSVWIQNGQIRNAAEAVQNGLQLSRAEAVKRNTNVQFVLTSVSGGGVASDWAVSCVTPVADLDGDGVVDCPGAGLVPTEIQKRPAVDGSRNAVVAASQSTIIFNGAGRANAASTVNVTNPTGGTCAVDAGDMRCLRVTVTVGGQIRMCDPSLASTDPRAC